MYAEVSTVDHLSPSLIRVTLSGGTLDEFEANDATDSYINAQFPPAGSPITVPFSSRDAKKLPTELCRSINRNSTKGRRRMKTLNSTSTTTYPDQDERPRFAIGHLSMPAGDVVSLTRFYGRLGMRVVVESPGFAILELRGGTHLILQPGAPGNGELDLMVDDIDATREAFVAEGVEASRITRGNPHDRFTTTDPEGNRLHVSSSHAMGPV